MPPPVSTLICLAAVLTVVVISRVFGRMAGMLAAATCGASVALVMPPAFSFEVDSFFDQVILAAYGAVSVLLLFRAPRERKAFNGCAVPSEASITESGIPLSNCVRHIVPAGVEVSVGDLTIRGSFEEAEAILREVFQTALAQPGVERLSIYGGRSPGVDRIWVAAQYRELPAAPCVLIAARLAAGAVTSFDNGYERVYQISLPRSAVSQ